ncbi:MAG: hypothetical protein NC548_41265, partial [Lachnospiraceae bacterium]|nr:hypothetical protein [Lachnospiraceae bacterium]
MPLYADYFLNDIPTISGFSHFSSSKKVETIETKRYFKQKKHLFPLMPNTSFYYAVPHFTRLLLLPFSIKFFNPL